MLQRRRNLACSGYDDNAANNGFAGHSAYSKKGSIPCWIANVNERCSCSEPDAARSDRSSSPQAGADGPSTA